MNKKTLILGLGNLVLKDEGVGIHAVQSLERETLPPNVDLLDGGTGGVAMIGILQEYDRIIMIDATLDQEPPGTVRHIRPRYSNDYPPLLSAHEIGLKEMIDAMILQESIPKIDLITVTVKDFGSLGMNLSDEVEQAMPKVKKKVFELLNRPGESGRS